MIREVSDYLELDEPPPLELPPNPPSLPGRSASRTREEKIQRLAAPAPPASRPREEKIKPLVAPARPAPTAMFEDDPDQARGYRPAIPPAVKKRKRGRPPGGENHPPFTPVHWGLPDSWDFERARSINPPCKTCGEPSSFCDFNNRKISQPRYKCKNRACPARASKFLLKDEGLLRELGLII
ncbi:atherin-like [Selaginella moellendorffii]|uniref:atherin-like n=1 Tax=Selaginella moellendorffii TaxID=88036 RepID=UPI000D1CA4B3|nr:atherin-like [Selaginella moellendorffii]|eukprot:XP_024532816.1 atherin-like [Selaginella moellendorffii]